MAWAGPQTPTRRSSTNYKKSLAIREELLRRDSSNAKRKRAVAINLMKIGGASDPHQPEAIASLRKGVAVLESLAAADPNNGRARREVGWGYKQLGTTQVAAQDYPGAVESLQKSLAIKESFAVADPQNAQASLDLASGHVDLAEALTAAGDPVRSGGPRAPGNHDRDRSLRRRIRLMLSIRATSPSTRKNSATLSRVPGQIGIRLPHNEPAAWSDARGAYEKAGEIFSTLRDHGTLPPADADQPQKFATRTADCQSAIEELTTAGSSR